MSEQRLKDFASEAEHLVQAPELDDLVGRGRDLRRLRLTVVAAAAVLVTVAGGILASVDHDDQTGPPAQTPDDVVPRAGKQLLTADEELEAGEQRFYVPSVFGDDRVWLRAPGSGWEWWGEGAVKWQSDDTVPAGQAEPYVRYTILPLEQVMAGRPCDPSHANSRWKDVGDDPTTAAEKIGTIPGLRLVQAPERTERFGVQVVHVGVALRTPCPNKSDRNLFMGNGSVIWGSPPGDYDVWIAKLSSGGLVMIAADHHPDVAKSYREQLEALLDSTRIDDGAD
ncbi:hypothetical protein EKO23_11380 [Nocardioides guangzhouensis]|uniref:Uncharacterized protein n=1 Tax=Nocardioides guangzhouensis TaxID=2497878 RepID=A0A4V1XZ88_9ACTN|nr:hypothetical protein [Nocardioides guangzhouensis]RYP85899.1 hypothetical protein EKO23_11380 [Nocardioides guangzhouensis]